MANPDNITLRSEKGSFLTFEEMDLNMTELQNQIIEYNEFLTTQFNPLDQDHDDLRLEWSNYQVTINDQINVLDVSISDLQDEQTVQNNRLDQNELDITENSSEIAIIETNLANRVVVGEVGDESINTYTGEQTVTQSIDRRGIVFDSVADMQAFAGLQVGAKVRTLGYYAPGDGGGNDYEIVAAGTGTDDGGSFIDLLGSGLQAKGLLGGTVNIRQFGAVGDGVTDDTAAIQNCINYCNPDRKQVLIPAGRFLFSNLTAVLTSVVGNGYVSRIREDFGSASWSDPTMVTGSVLVSTATTGNCFQQGDGSISPWYYGLTLSDFIIIGPGSGSSVGLYQDQMISGSVNNIAIANFAFGLDWNFVEDFDFSGIKLWGNDTAFLSIVPGNNQNCFYNVELNRNNNAFYITCGQGNFFYGGLVQSTHNNGVVIEPAVAEDIYNWHWHGVWFEKEDTMTGDIIRYGGDNIEGIHFEKCRFVQVGDISLTGGSNNRNHSWVDNIFIGAKNITIPVGMASVYTRNNRNANIVDNSKDSIIAAENGSFTGTLTGVDGTVTTTVRYSVSGRDVSIKILSITGTSNATSLTLIGLPQNTIPQVDTEWMPVRTTNDGVTAFGMARVLASGVVEFLSSPDGSGFNPTGQKGVARSSIVYNKDE